MPACPDYENDAGEKLDCRIMRKKSNQNFPGQKAALMERNYEAYSSEQFLDDPFFIEWVKDGTPESQSFWNEWIDKQPENLQAFQEAELHLRAILSAVRIEPKEEEAEEVWQRIDQSLLQKAKVVYMRKVRYWLTAAAVVLFIGAGTWFFVNRQNAEKEVVVHNNTTDDIRPGGNRAILTLADGSTIVLDSANTGAISTQGNVTVIKLNEGELSYQSSGKNAATAQMQYNTISTPRGGQYQLVLSDGTKVWLNAESSLRYPTAFSGKERKVELTGEGYFEVAHNASKPFYVNAEGVDVKVLGTHFNVNSYTDEENIMVTLLEGSVRVSTAGAGNSATVISPAQQASVNRASEKEIQVRTVDVEKVVAWKNGYFSFENAGIKTIMKNLARWYNIDVIYKGTIPKVSFSGAIGRELTLNQVLEILDETRIHHKLEGNKLIIMN